MALVLADRVKESSVTTGTGTFTLDGAITGYQTFSSAIGNGNTCYYTIASQTLNEWEVGIGTVGAGTLARTTILSSSNAGSAVNFSASTKDVFVTYPAEKSVYRDSAGDTVQQSFNALSVTNTATIGNAALTTGTISTTPAASTDIVNKSYVDTLVASGVHFHTPVRLESPTPLTVTYNNGTAGVGATLTNAGTQVALSIDGVATAVNDRILVYTQTNATQNGVYVVTDIGSGSTNWVMTRSDDTDTYGIDSPNALSQGSTFFVSAGVTGAGETYTCNTVGTITFGTTNITFAQISSAQIYSAGTGLTLNSTTFSITNTAVTAGSYGTASNVPNYTVNAQGQLTYAANTPIAISYTAVSGLAPSATTDTTNASNITSGTLPSGRLSGSYTGITGVGTIAVGVWNGSEVTVPYGGTGASTLTGYVYGNGASAMTASTTIPNTAITGLGTMSTQNANSVTITGGAINGTTVGTSSAAAGTFTFLTATTSYLGTVSTGTWQGTTIGTAYGGTGLTSFTSGGAVYATSSSALTTGTLPVGSGGTGATTLTVNNVLLGNGTSALQVVAPGTAGNVLTSNGTTWVSQAGGGGADDAYFLSFMMG
jgi:hypothetical protein